jgi:hypothetical protein
VTSPDEGAQEVSVELPDGIELFESQVRGLRFCGLVSGPAEGPPVLLLHGFPEFAECWIPLLRGLAAAGHHAVAFDQRGYSSGARPGSIMDYSIHALVADASRSTWSGTTGAAVSRGRSRPGRRTG